MQRTISNSIDEGVLLDAPQPRAEHVRLRSGSRYRFKVQRVWVRGRGRGEGGKHTGLQSRYFVYGTSGVCYLQLLRALAANQMAYKRRDGYTRRRATMLRFRDAFRRIAPMRALCSAFVQWSGKELWGLVRMVKWTCCWVRWVNSGGFRWM